MNQGAKRADLDNIYDKIKYISLQADLQLNHKVSIKYSNGFKEVDIKFTLENNGEVVATDIYVWIRFSNVEEILKCHGNWANISEMNANIPTIQLLYKLPVIRPVTMGCEGVTVKVSKQVKQIKCRVIMGAINMRTKDGDYIISLKEHKS